MKKSNFITLQDNLDHLERQAFTFRQKLLKNKFAIEEAGEVLPVSINVNGWKGTTYMNPAGEQTLHISHEEIRQMGSQFWQDYFEPGRFKKAVSGILNHWGSLKEGHPITYWNEVRAKGSKNFTLYSNTMVLLDLSDTQVFLVLSLSPNQLGLTNRKLSRLLEEDELVERYFKQFQQLTEREKQIIYLLVQGYSNPQISEQLYIARSTVETHRKNINKKLCFSSYFQLVRFAQAFDLV